MAVVQVVVAIPTFRRPRSLGRLLDGLQALNTDAQLFVLVADNDAVGREGVAVCTSVKAQGYRWPITAITVAERGISQTRNALIAHALGMLTRDFFLAMLDDDEWPAAGWLDNLLKVQRETNADIVQGPVLCEFPSGAPSWAILANSTPPPRTGSGRIAIANGGGNVLIRQTCLQRLSDGWFDRAFGLTGGEDKDFFVRMEQLGAKFAWAEDGVAYTSVPESRMTLAWALKRAYRAGNSDIRIMRKYSGNRASWAREGVKIAGALIVSPLRYLLAFADPPRRAQALFTFARAIGKATAPLGLQYQEYLTTHGY